MLSKEEGWKAEGGAGRGCGFDEARGMRLC